MKQEHTERSLCILREWRGSPHRSLYLKVNGAQWGRITLSPHNGTRIKPELSVDIPVGRRPLQLSDGYIPKLWRVRLTLPHFKWRYPMNRVQRALFRASDWYWRRWL